MNSVKLDKRADSEGTVYLPRHLYRDGIKNVWFSNKNMMCRPAVSEDEETVYLSDDLWRALSVPHPMRIQATVIGEALYFLPIIGLLTTGYTSGSLYPFGQRTDEYQRLITFVKKNSGCAFILTPDHFDWENETVNGIFYHNGKWVEKLAPFPQVVYDRIPNRKDERLTKVQEVKNKLQYKYGIPWFNPGFFDKAEIFEALKHHPISAQYLPQTYELNLENLRKALDLYPSVYVKPKKASHGIGIKLFSKEGEKIRCLAYHQGEPIEKTYHHVLELLSAEFRHYSPNQYLIQQGVTLPEYNGRPYDFRVHTNKDGTGKWQLSAVAAKTAGANNMTTHVLYGGDVKTLGEIYGRKKALSVLSQIKDACIALSEIIDQEIDGLIGELGFDVAVDREDRLWLFEANAKPGRIIFTKPAIRKQARFVDKYWFDYCTYLAELGIRKPQWYLSLV
ncbi:YheC/YheD family protein [Tuberibacillus calidus]|uniref:YheC/YheD family endospore coat-associated protein n=1 Tax=Tuberibacillus calidus TaxID=340097 RepID=UPI000412E55C|nr:YheC/YheD family protein [Tuberibacillus calidus]